MEKVVAAEKKAGQSGKIEYSPCFIPSPPFLLIRFVLAIGGSLSRYWRKEALSFLLKKNDLPSCLLVFKVILLDSIAKCLGTDSLLLPVVILWLNGLKELEKK